MPVVEFSPENVKRSNFDFPKLKLKKGERARITVIESPTMEYVHTLRRPVVIDGELQYETKQNRKGEDYTAPKLDFVSTPLCLGKDDILANKGSDPDNCPMCARAKAGEYAFLPKPRYAMHVVRYSTQPEKFTVSEPLQAQLLVWAFSETVFAKLVDFKNEWGNLQEHDLLLGPCQNEGFQKYDISVSKDAAWMRNDASKTLLKEIYAPENRAEDLSRLCGTRKSLKFVEEDLQTIDAAWAESRGETESGSALYSGTTSLTGGLDSLFDPESSTASAISSFEDLPSDKDAEGWHKDAEEKETKPATAKDSPKSESFEDLDAILAGL